MKKNILSAFAICAALFGCQKNEISETISSGGDLYATIEDKTSTKTVMDENNNIRWSEGDQIMAFMKTSLGLKYQLKPSYAGKTSGYFSKVSSGSSGDLGAGMELDHNVAYYPYAEVFECEKSGLCYILNVTLPTVQTYAVESFGNGSFPMVAVSENNDITFRNICGGMKLQLKGLGKVASITLHGNNSEKLSGVATVTAYADSETKPAITMASGASTSVTLECPDGVQLNENTATEFIIVLPPVLFSHGFTVTVTDSDNNVQTVETDKSNEVKRSSLLVMPEVTLKNVAQPHDYVDEYGINHGPGVEIDGVIWAPVNCGYHETDFKYGKLYQWGRKYGQGYDGDLRMYSFERIGKYSDNIVPEINEGGVSVLIGNDISSSDIFYTGASDTKDWASVQNDKLWNEGTEDNPIKTEFDPCPEGWRVPTDVELSNLIKRGSDEVADKQLYYLFYGSVNGPNSDSSVLFQAAGSRGYDGEAIERGYRGDYYSSGVSESLGCGIRFDQTSAFKYNRRRSSARSIRCVYDDSSLIEVASITISNNSLSLKEGESYTISTIIAPAQANHQCAFWWSSNSDVATVDSNGNVVAVSNGTAVITAMAGMQNATCEVVVTSSVLKD